MVVHVQLLIPFLSTPSHVCVLQASQVHDARFTQTTLAQKTVFAGITEYAKQTAHAGVRTTSTGSNVNSILI